MHMRVAQHIFSIVTIRYFGRLSMLPVTAALYIKGASYIIYVYVLHKVFCRLENIFVCTNIHEKQTQSNCTRVQRIYRNHTCVKI